MLWPSPIQGWGIRSAKASSSREKSDRYSRQPRAWVIIDPLGPGRSRANGAERP